MKIKKVFILLFISIFISVCFSHQIPQNRDLTEQQPVVYTIDFIRGLFQSLNMGDDFPEINNCLSSDLHLKELIDKLYEEIINFSGDDRSVSNLIQIIKDFKSVSAKLKEKFNICFIEPQKDYNALFYKFEDLIENLPPNFKVIVKNIDTKRTELVTIFKSIKENIKNGYKTGSMIGDILNLVLTGADYGDAGLESFTEFRLFESCFTNIISSKRVNLMAIGSFFKFIHGEESFVSFLYDILQLIEYDSDLFTSCSIYYKHLID
jgi:hypothetical protein